MTIAKLNSQGIFSNSGLGSLVLDEPSLWLLSDGDVASSGVEVLAGESLSVFIDFQNRFVLSEVRVWHTSGTVSCSSSMEGSLWDVHSTYTEAGYTSVSGSFVSFDNWPRRVLVELASASSTACCYEIELYGDPDGIREVESYYGSGIPVDSSSDHEVTTISVRNEGASTRNLYCCIDRSSSFDLGVSLALASTPSGVFYKPHEKGFRVPRDYAWGTGEMVYTTISGAVVVLEGTAVSGTYSTPVFDVSAMSPCLAYWEYYDETGTSIDSSLVSTDSPTMQVRVSNHTPIGGWVSGQAPVSTDPIWGTLSGTLTYNNISMDDLLTVSIGQYRYVQLQAQFNASVSGTSSRLSAVGLEESISFGSIAPEATADVYVQTDSSSYSLGQQSVLTTFFIE